MKSPIAVTDGNASHAIKTRRLGDVKTTPAFLLALALAACSTGGLKGISANAPRPPYAQSRLIDSMTWDFSTITTHRQAHGSDLWPCAWAVNGDLYCAWGDGGGFDGNDDNVGRVSLGFARVSGTPRGSDPSSVIGKNIWGAPPFAESAASFGGKVGSLVSVNGVLYAHGGFWTSNDTPDPVHKGGRGPHNSIAWSADSGKSWQVAAWSSPEPLGTFLDGGQDSGSAAPPVIYIYYLKSGDSRHLYLKRVSAARLTADPSTGADCQYFNGSSWWGRQARWSTRQRDAIPVFADANNVQGPTVSFDRGLGRYLLTVGHYASGNDDVSSAGQVGLFEAAHPWGPWSTIAYYENWGGGDMNAETRGDFLSLRLPSKWFSDDGTAFWAVFSGLNSYDSFNVVRGVLHLR